MLDKSMMVFIAVGIGFYYLVTTYVGDIQKEDEKYQNSAYQDEHKYDQYYTTDSIGQDIIDVTLADPKTQLEVWNRSQLKNEFLEIFPDFDTMKVFIKNRVRGEQLIRKLNAKVNEVEDKFFSGSINAEQAKRELENIK
jgi:hypothetical protein